MVHSSIVNASMVAILGHPLIIWIANAFNVSLFQGRDTTQSLLGMHHVGVVTDNLENSTFFYQNMMGAKPAFQSEQHLESSELIPNEPNANGLGSLILP